MYLDGDLLIYVKRICAWVQLCRHSSIHAQRQSTVTSHIHYTECNTSYVQVSIYSVLHFVLLCSIHIAEKLYKFHNLIIVQYIRWTRFIMNQMLQYLFV
jgi:hypothetical protein